MKKLMVMVVAMFIGTAMFAVEYKASDVPDWEKNPAMFLAYWKSVDSPVTIMPVKLARVCVAQALTSELKTKEATILAVDAYAKAFGVTDAEVILATKVECLRKNGNAQEAINLIGNSTNKNLLANKYYALKVLGKLEGCCEVAILLGRTDLALETSAETDNKARTFKLTQELVLGKPVLAPVLETALNRLADMNFNDTTVTPDMQIAFLKAVNAKYSRFLITDKAAWEPVIANVRTTLEGYGAK